MILGNNDVVRILNGGTNPQPDHHSHSTIQPIRWVGDAVSELPQSQTMWDLTVLKIIKAWLKFGIKGQGANVYVIDSGVSSSHFAFAKNLVHTQSFVPDKGGEDPVGHGTWVAAKIGGQGVGVAPRCNLTCLRALDESGTGSVEWSTNALKWIAQQPDPHVVNLSLGSHEKTSGQEHAIKVLTDMGVLVVAAAGNEGSAMPIYPAGFEETIAVTALEPNLNRAAFSNYGDFVDICAPGVQCYSAYLDGQYRKMDGTSMATPIVSGVLALGVSMMLAKDPFTDRKRMRETLLKVMAATAVDLGPAGKDADFGFGSLDAYAFLTGVSNG